MPGEPDPRLLRARETKNYDIVAALPLILWFAYGALQLRPVLVSDGALIVARHRQPVHLGAVFLPAGGAVSTCC